MRFESKLFFGFTEILRFLRKVILIDRFIRIKVKNYSLLVIFLLLLTFQASAMQAPEGGEKEKV